MSHILFTYHMKNDSEVAETCVTLPMTKEAADVIMAYGPEQIRWDTTVSVPVTKVYDILKFLSMLQGYRFGGVAAMERID